MALLDSRSHAVRLTPAVYLARAVVPLLQQRADHIRLDLDNLGIGPVVAILQPLHEGCYRNERPLTLFGAGKARSRRAADLLLIYYPTLVKVADDFDVPSPRQFLKLWAQLYLSGRPVDDHGQLGVLLGGQSRMEIDVQRPITQKKP